MTNKELPTTVCLTCSKVVVLNLIYENYTLATKNKYSDGLSFTCSNCGRIIAQVFNCRRCRTLTLKDLTVEWVRPDICLNPTEDGPCPQKFHPKYTIELPLF